MCATRSKGFVTQLKCKIEHYKDTLEGSVKELTTPIYTPRINWQQNIIRDQYFKDGVFMMYFKDNIICKLNNFDEKAGTIYAESVACYEGD